MATEQNPSGRRPHYHRGRRGPDRRGPERRSGQASDQPARWVEQVDVEQIMRDIRARIAQRQGVELSTQQVQELAARRLEALLDTRNVSPALMQQLRRGAAAVPEAPSATPDASASYSFEQETLYETHRGLLRFIRRLLNPILKLFFNPNPVAHALHTQARLNRESAVREAERERVQSEWNALHYEILQRLVTEVSRASVETQSLALRVEALGARVDFNDRRVRTLEQVPSHGQPRPQSRPQERPAEPAAPVAVPSSTEPAAEAPAADASSSETSRRRRRRRRGRRGGTGTADAAATPVVMGGSEGLAGPDTADIDGEDGDDDIMEMPAPAEVSIAAEAISVELPPPPATVPVPPPDHPEQLSALPEQPSPPPDEPTPQAPESPDPGPPDR